MGQWTITVTGHGIHDNGRDDDADVIFQRFVEELAGSQQIHSAIFTAGASRAAKIPEGREASL